MSNGAKVALAVGAGYLLGRTRKMRFALMLAAAGVTGKFPTTPTALVAQGLKSLGANADVSQLTEQLRGELLNAGRAAALTAATSQIDALNNRLQGVTSGADEALDGVGGAVGKVGRRRTRSEDDDYLDEDEDYGGPDDRDDELEDEPLDVDEVDDYGDEEDEPDDGAFDEADEDYAELDDEDEDVDDDEEPEEAPEPPVTRRRTARRPSAPRKSVRTTKRTAARSTARRGR